MVSTVNNSHRTLLKCHSSMPIYGIIYVWIGNVVKTVMFQRFWHQITVFLHHMGTRCHIHNNQKSKGMILLNCHSLMPFYGNLLGLLCRPMLGMDKTNDCLGVCTKTPFCILCDSWCNGIYLNSQKVHMRLF